MSVPTSRTVPSSPNPSAQGSPRTRDWSSLRTGGPGSAFRGIGRAKSGRGGGVRGGRGGGHPPANSGQKGSSQSDTTNSIPSPSSKTTSVPRMHPVPTSTATIPNGASEKAVNGSAEHGARSKSGSRKPPRSVPAVVVAPASPSETSQTAPPTPSRSSRRRRPQSGKGIVAASKPPPPTAIKSQKSRPGSTPASQTLIRKDVPPHLVAAHEAEIRHDINALVERVRAVAMAENRPTTPGSHIDWAGDEDDSLPDLDDWGVTTTHTNVIPDEDKSEEISPILADTLRPLPEPNSELHPEEVREMETYGAQSEQVEELPIQPTFLPSSAQGPSASASAEEAAEQCIIDSAGAEESSSPTLLEGKPPLHLSLPHKPVESLHAKSSSVSKPPSLPPKFAVCTDGEAPTTKTEGLSESMHAPSVDERLALERVSSTSSSERGLTASIHAPTSALPESHSAPSLLPGDITSTVPRTHSRSQTEGRGGQRQPSTSHRRGRSGASSPLGRNVYTHTRNHSTPAGGAGSRPSHSSRPVITGEAISRLARTIGGLPASRTQTIPIAKDSTISS